MSSVHSPQGHAAAVLCLSCSVLAVVVHGLEGNGYPTIAHRTLLSFSKWQSDQFAASSCIGVSRSYEHVDTPHTVFCITWRFESRLRPVTD